jgi:RNA polymerase sigma-70 factor (ECF subfamily)
LPDERELWERIGRGDAFAFDALYRAHAPKLQLFLRQILRSRQAAEDVMQETFAKIWKSPNGFEPTRGTIRAYLFGAARKRAAEWWRKNGAAWNREVENEPAEYKAEIASLIGDAFARLPEDQRTLIWLREVEGQSYAELAVILEIPVGTVRSRLFTAREALRSVWNAAPKQKKGDV